MVETPEKIRSLRDDGVLEVTWPNGHVDRHTYWNLRCACPCAACVNEFTGERILDPETVPRDIAPVRVAMSGNYALRIAWSDGHSTGLYSWQLLEGLSSGGSQQQD